MHECRWGTGEGLGFSLTCTWVGGKLIWGPGQLAEWLKLPISHRMLGLLTFLLLGQLKLSS